MVIINLIINGLEQGSKLYFSWFVSAINNVRVITANAVKMDWDGEKHEASGRNELHTSPKQRDLPGHGDRTGVLWRGERVGGGGGRGARRQLPGGVAHRGGDGNA